MSESRDRQAGLKCFSGVFIQNGKTGTPFFNIVKKLGDVPALEFGQVLKQLVSWQG